MSSTKVLESGKLSFQLPSDLRSFITSAITRRLENEESSLEDHTYFALLEAFERITDQQHKKRINLLFSHFYVVFSPGTMSYLNQDTQRLVAIHLNHLDKKPTFPQRSERMLIAHYPVDDDEIDDIPL